jgi:hypothetical protein
MRPRERVASDGKRHWGWFLIVVVSALFILLAVVPVKRNSEQPAATKPVERQRFIVYFEEYLQPTDHESVLKTILNDESGWSVIRRNNPASALPSDFAVIWVAASCSGLAGA